MATFALGWVVDQIIRSQPGSYSIPRPDGGELWVSPYGSGVSPLHLSTGLDHLEARQVVSVTSPDGSRREYEIAVSIREIPHVLSQPDDVRPAGEDLPRPDRAEGPDPQATFTDEPQEP